MEKIISTAIVLEIENIDTDQIIPAKFLKGTSREGFGKNLFYNWRYHPDGSPNPDFAFSKFESGSKILVAGNNFGCGSSREHAAWALADYGIQAVISSQFADIFKGNALNNGILPIEVSPNELKVISAFVNSNHHGELTIDLKEQKLSIDTPQFSFVKEFGIDPLKKKFLLEGITETEYLVNLRPEILAFEKAYQL